VAEKHDKRRRRKNERETVAACGKAPATERAIYDVSPGNTLIPSVCPLPLHPSPRPRPSAATQYCTLLSYRGRYEALASARAGADPRPAECKRDKSRLSTKMNSVDRPPRHKRRSEKSSSERASSGIVASRRSRGSRTVAIPARRCERQNEHADDELTRDCPMLFCDGAVDTIRRLVKHHRQMMRRLRCSIAAGSSRMNSFSRRTQL